MAVASVVAAFENGERRTIGGRECVYYDGYWIRHYSPPEDTLDAKRRLIAHLARRVFHHTEAGINTPGERLDEARAAFEAETDPRRKRVKGAMLAGALFNRAHDIFNGIVELSAKGVEVSHRDPLMRTCGQHFREAFELGQRYVRHHSGEEGIDELWGEPFKAFMMPIEQFYESRYIKIATAMGAIDRVAGALHKVFEGDECFEGVVPLIRDFAFSAKLGSETMKNDPAIFEVWPQLVAAGEALVAFDPRRPRRCSQARHREVEKLMELLRKGKLLIKYQADARVAMPKSTADFVAECEAWMAARKVPHQGAPPAGPEDR